MAEIDLDQATIAWLNDRLASYGGLAAHVTRDQDTARQWFLQTALDGISINTVITVDTHFITLRVGTTMGPEQLRAITTARIVSRGRAYVFDWIGIDENFDGDGHSRFEIVFTPERS